MTADRDAQGLALDEALAVLSRLLEQQEGIEDVTGPTERGEALRVVLAFVELERGGET